MQGSFATSTIDYNRLHLVYNTSDGVPCEIGYYDLTSQIEKLTISEQYSHNMQWMKNKFDYVQSLIDDVDGANTLSANNDLLFKLEMEEERYNRA